MGIALFNTSFVCYMLSYTIIKKIRKSVISQFIYIVDSFDNYFLKDLFYILKSKKKKTDLCDLSCKSFTLITPTERELVFNQNIHIVFIY